MDRFRQSGAVIDQDQLPIFVGLLEDGIDRFAQPIGRGVENRRDDADERPISEGAGGFARPTVVELKGKTQLTAIPDVTIDWDRLLTRV